MAAAERDVAQFAERAWVQIDRALRTGILETESGVLKELKPGEYARLVQWVASLDTRKRPKGVPLTDALLKETST